MISNDPDIFRPYIFMYAFWLLCVCVCVCLGTIRIPIEYKVSVQHKTFLLRDYARNWDPRKTHSHTQTTIYYDYYCYYDIVIMHSLTDSVLLRAFILSLSLSHYLLHSICIFVENARIFCHIHTYTTYTLCGFRFQSKQIHIYIHIIMCTV